MVVWPLVQLVWPLFQPMGVGSRVKEHVGYKLVVVVYLVHFHQGTSTFLLFSIGIFFHLIVPNKGK